MIIGVDFDGTVVRHEYPKVGTCVGAVDTLQELVDNGHKLILITMRSGNYLKDALIWFAERKIPLFAINDNPEQIAWTDSRKIYANLYIDDAALGTPLKRDSVDSRPYVDWTAVRELLKINGIL